jgi:hypothetical protein
LAARLTLLVIIASVPANAQVPLKKTDLTRADRSAWLKILKWPSDCEQGFQKTYGEDSYSGLEFYPVAVNQYVVVVGCYSGAYNPGERLYFYDELRSSARPLRLKVYERETNGRVFSRFETEIGGLVDFVRRKREVRVFSKARGIGDCGSLITYVFLNVQLVAKEARVQACYENPTRVVEPNHWPRVKKL